MKRRAFTAGLCASPFLLIPSLGRARTHPRITFIVLMDASGSMYENHPATPHQKGRVPHWKTQRDGHIAAFLNPKVQDLLIMQNALVYVLCWAGPENILNIVSDNGVVVTTRKDTEEIALRIQENTPQSTLPNSSTDHISAISEALHIYTSRGKGDLVIDISTDAGIFPDRQTQMAKIRDKVEYYGGTVNVFAVEISAEDQMRTLSRLVRTKNGFIMPGTYNSYTEGIQQKMLHELSV